MTYRTTGRRVSLPAQSLASNDDIRAWKKEKKERRKKNRKPRQTELLQNLEVNETPEELKHFLSQIAISESEDSSACSSLNVSRRGSLKKTPSIKKRHRCQQKTATPIYKSASQHHLEKDIAYSNNTKMDEEQIDFDEDVQVNAKECTQMTKFTEMEIVALWNQFKLNFQTGYVSKVQLTQLLQKVDMAGTQICIIHKFVCELT